MAKSEVFKYTYKEVEVAITFRKPPRKPIVEYTPPNLSEALQRELIPQFKYIVDRHRETGIVPPLEHAKQYAAYLCINREAFGGDITTWSPRDLAKEAGVTQEFAQFRIDMDLNYPHWRENQSPDTSK